jgi:hypothetical protein
MNRTRSLKFPLVLVILAAGCSSIHSTHLKRNEEACGWDTTHLHGIPITLDVPDKFKVEIVETQYYHSTSKRIVSNAADGSPVITRSVTVDVTLKKEIFTVDFVKPASGQLTTSADLDSKSQYFTEINNKITDTTIDSITNAINTIGSSITPLLSGKSSAQLSDFNDLQPVPKTVAVGFFDVNDRHALEKIHEFLCQHLNGCAPTCPVQPVVGQFGNHPAPIPPPPYVPGTVGTMPNGTATGATVLPPINPMPLPATPTPPADDPAYRR